MNYQSKNKTCSTCKGKRIIKNNFSTSMGAFWITCPQCGGAQEVEDNNAAQSLALHSKNMGVV